MASVKLPSEAWQHAMTARSELEARLQEFRDREGEPDTDDIDRPLRMHRVECDAAAALLRGQTVACLAIDRFAHIVGTECLVVCSFGLLVVRYTTEAADASETAVTAGAAVGLYRPSTPTPSRAWELLEEHVNMEVKVGPTTLPNAGDRVTLEDTLIRDVWALIPMRALEKVVPLFDIECVLRRHPVPGTSYVDLTLALALVRLADVDEIEVANEAAANEAAAAANEAAAADAAATTDEAAAANSAQD